jgi:hypothetical protein
VQLHGHEVDGCRFKRVLLLLFGSTMPTLGFVPTIAMRKAVQDTVHWAPKDLSEKYTRIRENGGVARPKSTTGYTFSKDPITPLCVEAYHYCLRNHTCV